MLSPTFRADLHCHSTCSDGTFTPIELIDHAVEIELTGLSITDHDCVEAFSLSKTYAAEKGIALLPGAEFSAELKGFSVHILAYSFNPEHPSIKEFCLKHKERRTARNAAIVDLLKENQMPIDPLPSNKAGSIGRPHIAEEMMKKGYVKDIREAFNKYLGDGKPCYHPGTRPSVQETIDLIHEAKGFAVIAHPHLIGKRKIERQLLEMNFDGIECYYAHFAANQERRWVEKAEERSWIITGGSDFHGANKLRNKLGASWVGKETFNILMDRARENSA